MLLLEWYFHRGIKINSFVVFDNIHDFFFHIINKNLKNFKPSKFKTYSPEVSYIQQRKAELHISWPSVNKSDIQRKSIQSLLYYIILIRNGKTSHFLWLSLYTSFSLKKEQNLKISIWFKFQIFIIFILRAFNIPF